MKSLQPVVRFGLLVPVVVFALSCSTPDQTTDAVSAGQDVAVRAAVDAHWNAINRAEATANPHTADITVFMPQFEKRFGDTSDEMRQLVARGKPPIPLVLRDVQIQMLDADAAIVTFFQDGSFWGEGANEDRRSRRVTEVWVKQGGSWKEAHHHDSVYARLQ
jgi:hypothetical protein